MAPFTIHNKKALDSYTEFAALQTAYFVALDKAARFVNPKNKVNLLGIRISAFSVALETLKNETLNVIKFIEFKENNIKDYKIQAYIGEFLPSVINKISNQIPMKNRALFETLSKTLCDIRLKEIATIYHCLVEKDIDDERRSLIVGTELNRISGEIVKPIAGVACLLDPLFLSGNEFNQERVALYNKIATESVEHLKDRSAKEREKDFNGILDLIR